MSTTPFIVLSSILFTIGCVGVLTRRNAIVVFMNVELMLNACNLALVAFAKQHGNLDGQVAAFFVMVVAAAEVVVGPGATDGVFSLLWLVVALPLAGAAILLLGGRYTDKWGHLLGCALPIGSFVLSLIMFFGLLGRDEGDRQVTQHVY